MKMPDFEKWADVLKNTRDWGRSETLENALKQAFDQGYHYGKRLGYEEGLNRGWANQMDKKYKNKEGGNNV